MSEGLNRVLCAGNLGRDPELRNTQTSSVLNFSVAATERYKDGKAGEWKERTEWVSCVVFGARAEALSKVLSKGTKVFVEGRLQTSSWETKAGEKRFKTEVVVDKLLLLGGGKERSESRSGGRPSQGDFVDDGEIPF